MIVALGRSAMSRRALTNPLPRMINPQRTRRRLCLGFGTFHCIRDFARRWTSDGADPTCIWTRN
jgi:hypothetical protein